MKLKKLLLLTMSLLIIGTMSFEMYIPGHCMTLSDMDEMCAQMEASGQRLETLDPGEVYQGNGVPIGKLSQYYENEFNVLKTDEERLAYLAHYQNPKHGQYICESATNWWLSTAYDDMTKFNYIASLKHQTDNSYMWVVNNPNIPQDKKNAFYRSEHYGMNVTSAWTWWWNNVGVNLKTSDTTKADASNFQQYMKACYGVKSLGFDYVGYTDPNWSRVIINNTIYYMFASDRNKLLAEGKMYAKQGLNRTVGLYENKSPLDRIIAINYYADSIPEGYKLWNTEISADY